MIATDGHGAGVTHNSTAVNDDFGGAATDIEQAAAEIALVLGEARFGGGQRLQHRVADQNSRAIRRRDQILRRGDRRSDQVNVGFEALTDHAAGVATAALRGPCESPASERKSCSCSSSLCAMGTEGLTLPLSSLTTYLSFCATPARAVAAISFSSRRRCWYPG